MWGGRNTQRNITGMCGECMKCPGHTEFASAHGVYAFPVTLLRLQVALLGTCLMRARGCMHFLDLHHSGSRVPHKGKDSVGYAFCALPGMNCLGDQVVGERTLPSWVVLLITSPHPSHSLSWVHSGCVMSCVCVSSGALISGCDPPDGCQPPRIAGCWSFIGPEPGGPESTMRD